MKLYCCQFKTPTQWRDSESGASSSGPVQMDMAKVVALRFIFGSLVDLLTHVACLVVGGMGGLHEQFTE